MQDRGSDGIGWPTSPALIETVTVPRGKISLIRGLGGYVWGASDHSWVMIDSGAVPGDTTKDFGLRAYAITEANKALVRAGCTARTTVVEGLFG